MVIDRDLSEIQKKRVVPNCVAALEKKAVPEGKGEFVYFFCSQKGSLMFTFDTKVYRDQPRSANRSCRWV